jgi:hypothetical protein
MNNEAFSFRPAWLDSVPMTQRAGKESSTGRRIEPKAFQSLSRNELRVLYVIRDAQNSKNRQAWPTVATIARLSGLSERTVINITNKLHETECLKKWRRGQKTYYSIPCLVKKRNPNCI